MIKVFIIKNKIYFSYYWSHKAKDRLVGNGFCELKTKKFFSSDMFEIKFATKQVKLSKEFDN